MSLTRRAVMVGAAALALAPAAPKLTYATVAGHVVSLLEAEPGLGRFAFLADPQEREPWSEIWLRLVRGETITVSTREAFTCGKLHSIATENIKGRLLVSLQLKVEMVGARDNRAARRRSV